MKRNIKDEEYLFIINSILENDEFKKMESIKHHNTTRLNHLLKVSYYSYKIAKFLRLDYIDVARGGLLHDFYNTEVRKCNNLKDKILLFSVRHPNEAYENALNNFDLSEKECDIIKSHMFPIDYKIPKFAESWVVSVVDKALSFDEFSHRFSYKIGYLFNLYLIFILNIIK